MRGAPGIGGGCCTECGAIFGTRGGGGGASGSNSSHDGSTSMVTRGFAFFVLTLGSFFFATIGSYRTRKQLQRSAPTQAALFSHSSRAKASSRATLLAFFSRHES